MIWFAGLFIDFSVLIAKFKQYTRLRTINISTLLFFLRDTMIRDMKSSTMTDNSKDFIFSPSNCHSKLINDLFEKEFEQTEFGQQEFSPPTSTQNQQSREPKQNNGFQSPSQPIFGSNSPFANIGSQTQKFGSSFTNINGVSSINNIPSNPNSPVKLGAAFDIPQSPNNFEIGKTSQTSQSPNFFNGINNFGPRFPALPQFSNEKRNNFNPQQNQGQSFGSAFGSPVGPANRPAIVSSDPDVEIISQVVVDNSYHLCLFVYVVTKVKSIIRVTLI